MICNLPFDMYWDKVIKDSLEENSNTPKISKAEAAELVRDWSSAVTVSVQVRVYAQIPHTFYMSLEI